MASVAMSKASQSVETARLAAWIAWAATLHFLGAVIASHPVSPQYNAFSDYISDSAISPQGWIFRPEFLAAFVGNLPLHFDQSAARKPAIRFAASIARSQRNQSAMASLSNIPCFS